MKVIVADDDPGVQLVLKRMCEQEGHTVDLASSTHDVAVLVVSHRYDAAAVDLMMPAEADGLEAVRLLLESGVPRVVMVTGTDALVAEAAMRDAGISGVRALQKPLSRELMRAMGLVEKGG